MRQVENALTSQSKSKRRTTSKYWSDSKCRWKRVSNT